MQQAEKAKAALVGDKERIFEKGVIDPIVAALLAEEVENFENLLCQPILPTIIKAKLYELLSSMIQVDVQEICEQILESKILNYIVIDYSTYENNTNILILLNSAVKSMLNSNPEVPMAEKILVDLKLIEVFGKQIEHEDYKKGMSTRKNIYPFIHNLTHFLQTLCSERP